MINIYKINNEKFKSIYFSYNFTMPVNANENSENALLASILAKSCKKYKTQKEIEEYLNGLYGSNFDINVEKIGDLYNIEFRVECVNKKFLPNNEDVTKEVLNFLYNIIYEPNIENSKFNNLLVEREKEFIIDRIKARKDDKLSYAVSRTEELLCPNEPFGKYLYGEEDIVQKITPQDLYKRYLGMLGNSCITVIISGNLEGYDLIEENVKDIFKEKIDSKLNYLNLTEDIRKENSENITITEQTETQETNQSVITFGLRVKNPTQKDFFALNIYNSVLGATPSSKLFQNFREKESLAYTVRSRYYRYKGIFVIYAGIQKSNYERAKEVIIKQLNDILLGNISDEEFNASKQSILADLREWEDSKIALSKMLLSNLIAYKSNDMSLDKIIDEMDKITKQDVIESAKRIEVEKIYLLGGENDV